VADENSRPGSLDQRTKIASEGMRGLFLINGGGAVALLAFLQSSWTNAGTRVLVPYIASALICLTLGVVMAAAVPFARIRASLHYESGNRLALSYSLLHRSLEKLSIAAFAIGVGVVVWGVFRNLP